MKAIFLDIDGVLNDHTQQDNGYCTIKPECAVRFNRILRAAPDSRIVISSAWRYLILNGGMTRYGFESLLLTHGVDCFNKVAGHTRADANGGEPFERVAEILEYVDENDVELFVVLDDLDLPLPESVFVRTDGNVGLTDADAERAIAILTPSVIRG